MIMVMVMVITHLDQCLITFARQRNSSLIMGMEEEDTRGTLNRFYVFLSLFGVCVCMCVGQFVLQCTIGLVKAH